MNEAGFEIGRDFIPNTFGRLFHSGNLDFGKCWTILFLFREKLDLENQLFKIVSRPSPSYNVFEMTTIGSLHGFGKKSISSSYSEVKHRFSCIFWFGVFYM